MAENSRIEWTDHTFNPWLGCTKLSAGCTNCYAEVLMDKRFGRVKWGPQGQRVRTADAAWIKPHRWNRQPWFECVGCGWRGVDLDILLNCPDCSGQVRKARQRVFCASLCDVFEDKPNQQTELDEWRLELFALIRATPWLDWLLLTKRPENVIESVVWTAPGSVLPANVWIGTSVENQEQADKRIPELLRIPAAVRFLSVEPLLGPVKLHISGTLPVGVSMAGHLMSRKIIDWVIVGGESGTNARPMHPDWARSIRDQCQGAGVPFFMKQMDKVQPIPNDLYIREFPELSASASDNVL